MTTTQQGRSAPELPNWIDKHLAEITSYQTMLEATDEDLYQARLEILSEMNVFIGKVAAEMSGHYKKIYSHRKHMQALAHVQAIKNKQAESELAVVDIRQMESQAYEDMLRWRNAFDSTKERINVLKMKLRISFEDGSSKG